MSTLRELRQAAGLSQEKLAELVGTSQPQINKLEAGTRKMTLDWAVRLGRVMNVDPAALLGLNGSADHAAEYAGRRTSTLQPGQSPRRDPMQPVPLGAPDPYRSMPVRAAARGGADQEMFLEDGPIDWIPKPVYLQAVRDPYAMYVVGESMMPRFRPAQLLHVNPFKPPAPGAGVVVVKRNKTVLIKEFVRRTPEGIVLREYRPEDREFLVSNEELDTMHTVVGLQEP